MLLMPGAIELAGVLPVILACGLTYLVVGVTGLALHARWIEPSEGRPG
jgi:hypothetical protein